MPSFSQRSLDKLATCHPDLQRVAKRAIKIMDFTVVFGHRGEAEQNALYAQGRTTPGRKVTNAKFPESKHNSEPSDAMDLAPYPIDWEDTERFALLAGVVLACAHEEGVQIRWGGDWDRDTQTTDERFRDYPHFERVP